MAVLAGDLGGTKTILAVYDDYHGPAFKAHYWSKNFSSFEKLLKQFLSTHNGPYTAACFGVPGPVINGTVTTTKTKWKLDAKKLSKITKCPVVLINDIAADAFGLQHLKAGDTQLISKARPNPKHSTKVIVAPGTGLGESILNWTGTHYDVVGGEGGHSPLAPRSQLEWNLKKFISNLGDTSAEAVLSGPGIVRIYSFMKMNGIKENPEVTAKVRKKGPEAIVEAAMKEKDPLSRATLDIFSHLLATECQRLALTAKALGGVYIAGGIAPHLIPIFRLPHFMKIFQANAMRDLLKRMPVFVVLNEELGLLGAVHVARTRVR